MEGSKVCNSGFVHYHILCDAVREMPYHGNHQAYQAEPGPEPNGGDRVPPRWPDLDMPQSGAPGPLREGPWGTSQLEMMQDDLSEPKRTMETQHQQPFLVYRSLRVSLGWGVNPISPLSLTSSAFLVERCILVSCIPMLVCRKRYHARQNH